MLLFKTRLRWWQWALGVAFGIGVVVLVVSLERVLVSPAPDAENLPRDPEILRSEIEAMLTFTHMENRPDNYPGPDKTLTTNYSAHLNDCWLTVTITRPDEAFCRVSENRTRIRIIENNLRFSDVILLSENRGRSVISFRPRPSNFLLFSQSQSASREVTETCGEASYSSDDTTHLRNIVYPLGAADGVAARLVEYRRQVCPTILDYTRFLRL